MKNNKLFLGIASSLLLCRPAMSDEVPTPSPTPAERITAAATESRLLLNFDGDSFSGPGWERLLQEGRNAQFFLVGEEHGIAENPLLVAQLFMALTDSGYSKLAIEISPPMAWMMDEVLSSGGLAALRNLYAKPGGEPAFFGMAEEAQMLASVRAAVPGGEPVLWGADYEVAGDRMLLAMLQRAEKPAAAETALQALVSASEESWARYDETGGPQHIFSFAGDPALVGAVSNAWPEPDAASAWILDSLEETLSINRAWSDGNYWASNQRRAAHLRANFLRHWRTAKQRGQAPRVLAKFGANHLVRGRNMTNTYDLGTLLPELAALEGGHSFSVMVIPGAGSMTAVLDPTTWRYSPAPAKDSYADGIEAIAAATFPGQMTLVDLAPLRPLLSSMSTTVTPAVLRTVFGYDMLLIMSGSTAATELEHE